MHRKKYIWLFIIPLLMAYILKDRFAESKNGFSSNPELLTIPPSDDWKGNPLDDKGKFTNLYHPFESSFGDLWKWQTSKNPQKEEKKAETRRLPVDFDSTLFQKNEDYLIWLGHASYLIQIHGKTFLTDPLLLDNTFLKRESELPFPIDQIPQLDYILLSHNHRDHCDKQTLNLVIQYWFLGT